MKKNKYVYAWIIAAFAVATFLAYEHASTGWAQYTNSKLGFSFEYPSGQITPTPDGSFGFDSVRIDNNGGGKIQVPANSGALKMVVVNVAPVDSAVKSLDDFVSLIRKNKTAPGSDPSFPNLGYTSIAGEKAAIEKTINGGGDPIPVIDQDIDVYFFHDNQIRYITISNLSPADAERVWKSFRFLK